jgi:hypothetical protein
MEVSSDVCCNFVKQRRVVSTEMSGLNNKLKCAVLEVNSLNLIMQLLWNELTSECVMAILVANPPSDE